MIKSIENMETLTHGNTALKYLTISQSEPLSTEKPSVYMEASVPKSKLLIKLELLTEKLKSLTKDLSVT